MKDGPRILVAGCGSMGRRHIKNLKGLGITDFVLCDPSEVALEKASAGLDGPVSVKDFGDALEAGAHAAVVAAPSSMHMEMSTELAGRGVDLFIEKPLSHTMDGVKDLIKLVDSKQVVAMMGMCYRFHPVLRHIKKLLDAETIGALFHVNYYGGHYLPDWHPNADYRTEYAANKHLGGGVILTSIHGFDNMRWLFGEVHEIAAFVDRVGILDMDVEDLATGVFRMKSGLYITWQTDFLQRVNQHRMIIVGEKGTLRCDLVEGVIETYLAEYGKWYVEKVPFEINTMYVEEMKHFLDCIENRKRPAADIVEGYKTLELAIGVKQAGNRVKREICLTG